MSTPDSDDWRDGDVVAVIPARDEAGRLPRTIATLHAQGVRVLVVANGCGDETAPVARRCRAAVLETDVLRGGVGEARRLGMALALALVARPAIVLTTDADCTLAAGTIDVLRRALGRADAAFGRVVPDAAEFATLPRHVRRHGRLEDRHTALLAEIEGLRAATPWDPLPRHGQTPGALIAFRPGTYRATGGFAPVPTHEDRLMAETLTSIGARIARPWHAAVHASCRLTGRAPGGMAATIAARAGSDLRAETRWLALDCARLEREVAALRRTSRPMTNLPTTNLQTGDDHVLPFRQAAI